MSLLAVSSRLKDFCTLKNIKCMGAQGLLCSAVYSTVSQTSKCPKISIALFCTFLAQLLLFMQLFPKIPSGIANSVDPDQTAPEGAV